ncbi:MAG: YaaR family protein [Sporolactobacillus sp.]
MPIEINRRSSLKETTSPFEQPVARNAGAFEQTLRSARAVSDSNVLTELAEQIDAQAKRVAGSRTVRDLQIYKKYVQSFLRSAVQLGLKTAQSRAWQQGGAQQTLVKNVNQKLLELTDEMLDKNKESLDLLGKLGEIRGMLINLYV